jgi:hypothetical protein
MPRELTAFKQSGAEHTGLSIGVKEKGTFEVHPSLQLRSDHTIRMRLFFLNLRSACPFAPYIRSICCLLNPRRLQSLNVALNHVVKKKKIKPQTS